MGMVLKNANIYTSDEHQPRAELIAVEGGLITYIGDQASFENTDGLVEYDLGGRAVVPGFIDSHTHPSMVSQSQWHVRLPWTSNVSELLEFIAQYAEDHPPEEMPYLYFEYYPTDAFTEMAPTKELLDSAVSDRPVLCQNFSEHEHWVNSKMLELMEVTGDTPDPVPGLEMFVRDENGEPTGLLRDFVHLHFLEKMFENLGWTPPEQLTPERVAGFFRFMTEHGVTSVFEALVEDEEIFESVNELDSRGELNMYYEGSLRFRHAEDLPYVIARLKGCQKKYGTEHININTLKLFLDGTNETGNSALLSPLCDHSTGGELGEIGMDADELEQCLVLCNSEEADLHIHVVGDRGFRVACDAVEAAQNSVRGAGGTWTTQVTLAHCELIDPEDMSRPAELGIVINWTAHWSGAYFGVVAKKLLGRERWNRMYRFNELADSGALLTFSSDVVTAYELHRGNPLFGMQVAHSRIDPEYPLDGDAHPGSMRPDASARISRERLLEGYTINGAKQLRLNHKMGSLEAGKIANFSVLGEDPFTVDPASISNITFDAVVFEGAVVAGSLGGQIHAN